MAGERAKEAALSALKVEIATARKEAQDKSYCWTTKDVARFFEVHGKTVDRWRRRLRLPSKKIGRSVKFCPGDVRRWAAQRKEG
jgi:hypothetical protein